jgi:hypothetical protein
MVNNPLKYGDPSGYFSEEEIIDYFGVETWEEVLKLFEEGGKYEGRWGWLETLRNAEIGDEILVEWIDEAFPEDHPVLDMPLEFGLDPQGKLVLIGDDFYLDLEAAGLLGDSYVLTQYTDLTDISCSPFTCGYSSEFATPAEHDPYIHAKVQWEQFGNPIAIDHLAVAAGATLATGVLTVAFVPIVVGACSTGIGCVVGVTAMAPNVIAGAAATGLLAKATYEIFLHEFLEFSP